MEDLKELSQELSFAEFTQPLEISLPSLLDHQAISLTSLLDESSTHSAALEQNGPDEQGYYHHFPTSGQPHNEANENRKVVVTPSTSPSHLTHPTYDFDPSRNPRFPNDDNQTSEAWVNGHHPAVNVWSAPTRTGFDESGRYLNDPEVDDDYDVSERTGPDQSQDVQNMDDFDGQARPGAYESDPNQGVGREANFAWCLRTLHQQDMHRDEHIIVCLCP